MIKLNRNSTREDVEKAIEFLPYGVEQNSEGTPEESLMAGWVNAMDMQDDQGKRLPDDEFVRISLSEFCNMGYDK